MKGESTKIGFLNANCLPTGDKNLKSNAKIKYDWKIFYFYIYLISLGVRVRVRITRMRTCRHINR